MSELPPYSGDDAVCAKCGFGGADTEYQAIRTYNGMLSEQLRRTCKRCGYAWDEAVSTDE